MPIYADELTKEYESKYMVFTGKNGDKWWKPACVLKLCKKREREFLDKFILEKIIPRLSIHGVELPEDMASTIQIEVIEVLALATQFKEERN